jgi:hypothetical protein
LDCLEETPFYDEKANQAKGTLAMWVNKNALSENVTLW